MLLTHLGAELRLKRFHERPVYLVNFFITQSAVFSTVFETQSNGTLVIRNAFTFVRADKVRANEVFDPGIARRSQQLGYGDVAIDEQRNVTDDRGKTRQRRIEHWKPFSLEQHG